MSIIEVSTRLERLKQIRNRLVLRADLLSADLDLNGLIEDLIGATEAVLVLTPNASLGALSSYATAQGLVMQRNLSLAMAMAKTIAEGSLAECKSKGFNTAVALVDRAGQVMVIQRDEQATAQQAEMARRNAYTARMFRTTTLEFQKRTSYDSTYAAQRDIADIRPWRHARGDS